MKVNLKIKLDYKAILPFVLKRFSLVLWVILCAVVIAEALTIKTSITKINQANTDQIANTAQLLRVNFTTYDAIDKRLTANSTFVPTEFTGPDPFTVLIKNP